MFEWSLFSKQIYLENRIDQSHSPVSLDDDVEAVQ